MHLLLAESLAASSFSGKKKRTKHRHIVSMFGPIMVRVTGVEPARLATREPKSRMSANSIIPADLLLNKNSMKLLLKKPIAGAIGFCGAAYEARTRYLHLGKVALYRMS